MFPDRHDGAAGGARRDQAGVSDCSAALMRPRGCTGKARSAAHNGGAAASDPELRNAAAVAGTPGRCFPWRPPGAAGGAFGGRRAKRGEGREVAANTWRHCAAVRHAVRPPLVPYPFSYHTCQMMFKDGGVCGTMAEIAARTDNALGIPVGAAGRPTIPH